jgi:single-stranded DNA-specific DHH superfamily exonuclease
MPCAPCAAWGDSRAWPAERTLLDLVALGTVADVVRSIASTAFWSSRDCGAFAAQTHAAGVAALFAAGTAIRAACV